MSDRDQQVDERLRVRPAHGVAIPDRVDADQQSGQERIDERPPAGQAARHEQQDDAGGDRRRARQRERPGVLAQEGDGAGGGEDRPGAARERIDEREVARRVAALQQHEIARVQEAAHDRQPDDDERDVRGVVEHGRREREREQADQADERLRPDEGRAARRALGERVPARMPEGGDEHERERERGHARKPTRRHAARPRRAGPRGLGTVGCERRSGTIRFRMSKTKLAVAGGIVLLAVATAAAGYPASALVIVGLAFIRVAFGVLNGHRASPAPRPAPEPDPRGEEERAFAQALNDDVVGVDDFLAAARMRETSGHDGL